MREALRLPVLVGLLASLACGGESERPGPPAAPLAGSEPASPAPAAPAPRSAEILSPVFHVDRKFRSMEGPSHVQNVSILDEARAEPVWLTGYRVTVVDAGGESPAPSEFMCHNNLDFDPERHGTFFGWSKERWRPVQNRVFTLSQGLFDFELPDGFGVPVLANETLRVATQVLNHNIENPDAHVRHRIEVDFVRDTELEQPLRPLFPLTAQVMAALGDEAVAFAVENPEAIHEGASCAPGIEAENAMGIADWEDPLGRRFTGHWVVPPGREVRHTLITKQLDLPFDTTIHAIAVHLHPFAESLAFRDLTRDETLWTAYARAPETGIGLAEVGSYRSAEGIPVYADHEYEMVSVYDNTSGVDQDAMAVMFFYLHDREAEQAIAGMRRRASWASESH
jgi:hypothetical protein